MAGRLRKTTAERQPQHRQQRHGVARKCPNKQRRNNIKALALGATHWRTWAVSFSRLKLLLGHLQVPDVGDGTVQKRTFGTSTWKREGHP
jgi:hypothetical protein